MLHLHKISACKNTGKKVKIERYFLIMGKIIQPTTWIASQEEYTFRPIDYRRRLDTETTKLDFCRSAYFAYLPANRRDKSRNLYQFSCPPSRRAKNVVVC